MSTDTRLEFKFIGPTTEGNTKAWFCWFGRVFGRGHTWSIAAVAQCSSGTADRGEATRLHSIAIAACAPAAVHTRPNQQNNIAELCEYGGLGGVVMMVRPCVDCGPRTSAGAGRPIAGLARRHQCPAFCRGRRARARLGPASILKACELRQRRQMALPHAALGKTPVPKWPFFVITRIGGPVWGSVCKPTRGHGGLP